MISIASIAIRMVVLLLLVSLVATAQQPPKPERVIVFIMDGLHHKAPDRLDMPNLRALRNDGVWLNNSVMIAPHHPTVGDYGSQHTCSFPNPVLQQGTLFIKPENKYFQEWFPASATTCFLANTNAYASVTRGFKYIVQDPAATDSALVNQGMTMLKNGPVSYMRLHLQTPGNLGRYLSYTTPDKPYYRNLWGKGSPYVTQLEAADRHLGRFINFLKANALWEGTLLVVTSDQGQSEIGWHPVSDPDSWQTPLVMVGPGIAKNRKLNYLEHSDLTITLASILGLQVPKVAGMGRVERSILATEPETSTANPRYTWTINQQCQEYAMLRARIQLETEQNRYSSSYLTFLENNLLTPEPFYHLDRFTEWHKAGTVDHLIEVNERLLGQMKQYLAGRQGGVANAEAAVAFSPRLIRLWQDRVIQYHTDSLAPTLTIQKDHWKPEVRANPRYKWPSNGCWNAATYYAALADVWEKLPDPAWQQELTAWGERNQWVPTNWDVDMANNHLAGHAWLNLYEGMKARNQQPSSLYTDGIKAELDRFMAAPFEGKDAWWWCDALYMAPPTFHHMTAFTGDKRYAQYANEKWWVTTTLLMDPKENLFFRDTHYVWEHTKLAHRPKAVSNTGGKVFCSRGNGWVVAGIGRVLPYLDKKDPERAKYIKQLNAMMSQIIRYQLPSGGWSVSLQDSLFKTPETSATALFTFAMARGIRLGVLDAKKYTGPMQKAWLWLTTQLTPTGKVLGAQRVGHDPTATTMLKPDHFSQGVWLQAAEEMRMLYPDGLPASASK